MKTLRIILWGGVLVFAGLLGWLTFRSRSRRSRSRKRRSACRSARRPAGKRSPNRRSWQATALFFGFTHCPEICRRRSSSLTMAGEVDPDAPGCRLFRHRRSGARYAGTAQQLHFQRHQAGDRHRRPAEKVAEVIQGLPRLRKRSRSREGPERRLHDGPHGIRLPARRRGRFKGTISYGEKPGRGVQKLENLKNG